MTELPKVPDVEAAAEAPEGGIVLTRPPSGDDAGIHVVLEQIDAAWKAAYYIDTRTGVPTIVEVRIVPIDQHFEVVHRNDPEVDVVGNLTNHQPIGVPQRPLSARALQRRLRPGHAVRVFQTIPGRLTDRALAELGLSREILASKPNRHRRGLPDYFLAGVSKLYVAALDRGSPRPVADVTEQLNAVRGSRHKTEYVRDLLVRARSEGFLDPASPGQGKPAGWLTRKSQIALDRGPREPLGARARSDAAPHTAPVSAAGSTSPR